jgi:hypothetical protein
MRFRLRTLLIVLTLGPPVLAIGIVILAAHGIIPRLTITSNGKVTMMAR